jgi:hypothetical protein
MTNKTLRKKHEHLTICERLNPYHTKVQYKPSLLAAQSLTKSLKSRADKSLQIQANGRHDQAYLDAYVSHLDATPVLHPVQRPYENIGDWFRPARDRFWHETSHSTSILYTLITLYLQYVLTPTS